MTRFQEDPNEQVFLGTLGKVWNLALPLELFMYLVCIDTPTLSTLRTRDDREFIEFE